MISFNAMDSFFKKRQNKFFLIGLILTLLFGLLLFDIKVSEGTDDSGYIMSAFDFIRGLSFPIFHGSIYAIFLGLLIKVFGFHLVFLKIVSLVLITGHLIFLFFAFKNKIPSVILCMVILIIAVNSPILFFASTTYSEALFIFLQALSAYILFLIIKNLEDDKTPYYQNWQLWVALGFCAFLMTNARNIGIGFLISIVIYFAFNRQFKASLYAIISFLLFQVPFQIYKAVFWKVGQTGLEGQFGEMLYKDHYNHYLGKEDLSGLFIRLFRNANNYLSSHFFSILGLRSYSSSDKNILLTIVLSSLLVLSFFLAKRNKNNYLKFLSVYIIIACCATFISTQVKWDQDRLILVYIPFILLLLGSVSYDIKPTFSKITKPLLIAFLSLVFILTFIQTLIKAKENFPTLRKNLKGDILYGYSPDFENYIKASIWANARLPKDAVIACRKPELSFLYTENRNFFGIYSTPKWNADSSVINLINSKTDAIYIDYKELDRKNISYTILDNFSSFVNELYINRNHIYILYIPSSGIKSSMLDFLKGNNITAMTDLIGLSKEIEAANDKFYAENPDELLKDLRKAKVKYLILGSLRYDETAKTKFVISTIHNYVKYIDVKYPTIFKEITQIGAPNNEPALIIELSQ